MKRIIHRAGNVLAPTLVAVSLLFGGCAEKLPVSDVVAHTDGIPGNTDTSFADFAAQKTYQKGNIRLIPGGEVFGVKFFTRGVIIVDTGVIETEDGGIDPAREAGIAKNDVIRKIDGHSVNTVEEVAEKIAHSDGSPLQCEICRGNHLFTAVLTPAKCRSDGTYKTGLWIRDSTAGIGTMTFYDASDGYFAGLGHGICDADTGTLMPLLAGTVVDVTLTDIVRGKAGCPGELKGSFSAEARGSLSDNTACGVSGYLYDIPKKADALPVADKSEVHDGDAVILSDIAGNGTESYTVRLSAIDRHASDTKCFSVEVTDERLLSVTGGIIQGMSGSPILQDGRLVGAVTHVLIGDPTKGYGIFAENMLPLDKAA